MVGDVGYLKADGRRQPSGEWDGAAKPILYRILYRMPLAIREPLAVL